MTREETNRFLTEAMGLCWHEWVIENSQLTDKNTTDHYNNMAYAGFGYECSCGYRLVNRVNWHIGDEAKLSPLRCRNTNFFTWEGFGKLWEWAQKQEWWFDFLSDWYTRVEFWGELNWIMDVNNPERFATALVEFLEGRNNG